jgi:hypothetical protein
MAIPAFSKLRLVGGTALALQLGHRSSIDIDLFGEHHLDDHQLSAQLSEFAEVVAIGGSSSIKAFFINDIKVDIVNYPYPWIASQVEEDGIRMASILDIAAMKIAAIEQRGSKKDFIDLYFLLQQFSLSEILQFYQQKITDGNEWIALRSLAYFEDAEREPMPTMFSDASWLLIKNHIANEVRKYSRQ